MSSRLTTRSLAASTASPASPASVASGHHGSLNLSSASRRVPTTDYHETEPDENESYEVELDQVSAAASATTSNLVIITTAAASLELKDSEVTQPPAVLTAAAALGMNLSTSTTTTVPTSADDSGGDEGGGGANGDGSCGGGGGSNSSGASAGSGSATVNSDGGGNYGALLMTRGRALKQRLSESSQTSRQQHVVSSDVVTICTTLDSGQSAVASGTQEPVNHVAVTAACITATATPRATSATPTVTSHDQELSEDESDEVNENHNKMIDASDFRMVDPGCSYTTLAAAAAANGRMTPPNHGHTHQHPHHALHHSHAMASYVNTSYTTLTQLQPLPPISTISNMHQDSKYHSYSPSGAAAAAAAAAEANGEPGNTPTHVSQAPPVSVSNFVMQTNLSPYMSMSPPHYATGSHAAATAAAIAMGAHSPPQGSELAHHYPHNGGSGLHSKQEPLSPNSYYAEAQRPSPHHDMSPHSLDHSPTGGSNGGGGGPPAMVPTSTYDALTSNNNPSLNGGMTSPHTISPVPHTSPLLHHREMSPPSPQASAHHGNNGASILAAAAASALGHHNQHHGGHGMNMPIATPTMVTLKSTPSSNNNNTGGGAGGEAEEINTKDLAQRISAELKRYSIPQAIFAQRVLCRSQGTLSDLLRNPKPWSKLKSGRETFRRMQKWLAEPEFQRMSSLRLAGKSFFSSNLLKVSSYLVLLILE